MATTANQINLDPKLASLLQTIGAPQSTAISGSYGRYGDQMRRDARPGATVSTSPGTYGANRLAVRERLSQGGLSSGLAGVLGGEGLADWKSNRDFGQNMALAQLSGDLMKPSTLEQVLGGLGVGAKAGGQFAGLYNSMKKPQSQPYQDMGPSLNYYNPGSSGYGRYQ